MKRVLYVFLIVCACPESILAQCFPDFRQFNPDSIRSHNIFLDSVKIAKSKGGICRDHAVYHFDLQGRVTSVEILSCFNLEQSYNYKYSRRTGGIRKVVHSDYRSATDSSSSLTWKPRHTKFKISIWCHLQQYRQHNFTQSQTRICHFRSIKVKRPKSKTWRASYSLNGDTLKRIWKDTAAKTYYGDMSFVLFDGRPVTAWLRSTKSNTWTYNSAGLLQSETLHTGCVLVTINYKLANGYPYKQSEEWHTNNILVSKQEYEHRYYRYTKEGIQLLHTTTPKR